MWLRNTSEGIELKINVTGGCVVLELVPLRGKDSSSHAHRSGSWYILKIPFKISNKQPPPILYIWAPSPHPPGVSIISY